MNDKRKLKSLEKKINQAREEFLPQQEQSKPQNVSAFDVCAEFITPMIVGGVLGFYLDKKFDTMPFSMIGLFFLGSVAGGFAIYKLIKKLEKNE